MLTASDRSQGSGCSSVKSFHMHLLFPGPDPQGWMKLNRQGEAQTFIFHNCLLVPVPKGKRGKASTGPGFAGMCYNLNLVCGVRKLLFPGLCPQSLPSNGQEQQSRMWHFKAPPRVCSFTAAGAGAGAAPFPEPLLPPL